MAFRKNVQDGFTATESERRQLGYVDEFKDFISQHPKVMNVVLRLMSEIQKQPKTGQFREEDNVRVEMFYHNPDDLKFSEEGMFKISVGGNIFFCKKIPRTYQEQLGGGYNEIIDTRRAREILEGAQGVRVIDFQLGYQDKNHAYFVSRWNQTCMDPFQYRDYYNELNRREPDAAEALEQRKKKIISLLESQGYINVANNLAYDPQEDIFYVYDLNDYNRYGDAYRHSRACKFPCL